MLRKRHLDNLTARKASRWFYPFIKFIHESQLKKCYNALSGKQDKGRKRRNKANRENINMFSAYLTRSTALVIVTQTWFNYKLFIFICIFFSIRLCSYARSRFCIIIERCISFVKSLSRWPVTCIARRTLSLQLCWSFAHYNFPLHWKLLLVTIKCISGGFAVGSLKQLKIAVKIIHQLCR